MMKMCTVSEGEIEDILNVAKILSLKNTKFKSVYPMNGLSALPDEITFKITTRCTFRCKHCYLWNKKGYYRQFNTKDIFQDINLEIIDKVLYETNESNAAIRISGGEPLIHCNWHELLDIIAKYNRKVTLFTNGFLINNNIEPLLKISKNLNTVISIDGMASEHNYLRGKNTFSKVIQNIKLLTDLKKQKIYHGRITINSFLSNELVLKLFEFIPYVSTLDADKIYLNFPWFLDKNDAMEMDMFYKNNFAEICIKSLSYKPSWHTFTYQLTQENLKKARSILKSHREIIVKKNIRINPSSEYIKIIGDNLPGYKALYHVPVFCTAINKSMFIQPEGKVTACTAFPELETGTIGDKSVKEIWNCNKYNSLRKILNGSPLPGKACLKCPYFSSNFYNL